MNNDKCRTTLWNILRVLKENKDGTLSSVALGEFFQTQRCDQYVENSKGLSRVREDLKAYIEDIGRDNEDIDNRPKLNNILYGQPTTADEYAAMRALTHYGDWIEKQCVEALPFIDRVHYHTLYKPSRFLSVLESIGIVGSTSFVGMEVIKRSMKYVRNNNKR